MTHCWRKVLQTTAAALFANKAELLSNPKNANLKCYSSGGNSTLEK